MPRRPDRSARLALAARILLYAVILLAPAPLGAASTEIGPADDLRAAVNALQPGDELVLRGGLYTLTFRFSITVSGTVAQPIVIRAKTGETPHLTRDPIQNTINVEGVRHLVLRGLEVSGGSHGIRLVDASFVTVEDCHVHDTAAVGISANMPGSTYEGLRLLRNHIHNTGGSGEGYYLGCNNTDCVMFGSLIEGNHIHDTILGTTQGDGIEIKIGSYDNVVRENLIHDTRYPCIIVYGTNGMPVNLIERNTMWGCGDHGIQAAADAILRNNVILGAAADGIHSQLHQGAAPGNLLIAHNTVLNSGDALRISDIAGPVMVVNNALYSQSGLAIRAAGNTALISASGNLGTGATSGIGTGYSPLGDRLRDFVDAAAGDAHLPAGSALVAAGDPAGVVTDDRDGLARNGVADIGAYRFATPCAPAMLPPTAGLRLAKSLPASIAGAWSSAPGVAAYHLNSVTGKLMLTGDGPNRPLRGNAGAACDSSLPGCVFGAPPEALVYYQLLATCGLDGFDEGPSE